MPQLPQRKSIRLQKYDYAAFGYYFVTICAQNRELYFENNNIKQIAKQYWHQIPNHFQNTKLDEFIIMPNHIHGIIIIENNNVGARFIVPETNGFDKSNPYKYKIKNNPMLIIQSIGTQTEITRRICRGTIYRARYFRRAGVTPPDGVPPAATNGSGNPTPTKRV